MPDRRRREAPVVRNAFSAGARAFTRWLGSASAAVVAVTVVGAWLLVGLVGGFSERWLALLYVITGGSTFVTVFFIQHTTDRDSRAILLKLDELIRAVSDAREDVIAVEDQPLHAQEQLEDEVRADARSDGTPPEPRRTLSGEPSAGRHRSAVSDGMPEVDDFDELVELVSRQPTPFVRHSKGPHDDIGRPSLDYEADVELPGLSVATIAPEPWWTRPAADWVARRVCKYAQLTAAEPDRRPWLLTGRVAGHGPDHEPIITEVTPIAWIGPRALREAERRYESHFEVGRDSRG